MASGGAPPPAAPRPPRSEGTPIPWSPAPSPARAKGSSSGAPATPAGPLDERIADLVTRLDALDSSSSMLDTLSALVTGRDLCAELLAGSPDTAQRTTLTALRDDLVTFLASPAGALTPADVAAQLAALRTRLLDALRPLLPAPAPPFWKRLPFGG